MLNDYKYSLVGSNLAHTMPSVEKNMAFLISIMKYDSAEVYTLNRPGKKYTILYLKYVFFTRLV